MWVFKLNHFPDGLIEMFNFVQEKIKLKALISLKPLLLLFNKQQFV